MSSVADKRGFIAANVSGGITGGNTRGRVSSARSKSHVEHEKQDQRKEQSIYQADKSFGYAKGVAVEF
jgi:hypothetical protein